MYLTDGWTFLVELKGDPPLASSGTCLVDLTDEDMRGDIEPYFDEKSGTLGCTIGNEDAEYGHESREITLVWEYREEKSFNGIYPKFSPISLVDFVRRVCDATTFDGYAEKDVEELKRSYRV